MLAVALRRFDDALVENRLRNHLEAGARLSRIRWAQSMLVASIPLSLQSLLVWHNGETPSSTLFHALVEPELEPIWRMHHRDARFEAKFFGTIDLVAKRPLGCVLGDRGKPERATDEPTFHIVPFLGLFEHAGDPENDWYIGVDTREESVWLYAVNAKCALPISRQAPSLGDWFEHLLERIPDVARAREGSLPPAFQASASSRDSLRLIDALVEEEAIELTEGARERLEGRVREALSLRPRARALSGIMELLSSNADVEEVFASDEELTSIVNRFMG